MTDAAPRLVEGRLEFTAFGIEMKFDPPFLKRPTETVTYEINIHTMTVIATITEDASPESH